MKIEELFWLSGRKLFAAKPEMDPLTEKGALQESQLLDMRFDAVTSTAGLLFDLRQGLQLRSASTGVMVVHEVEHLKWQPLLNEIEKEMLRERLTQRSRQHRAWSVIGEELRPTGLFNGELVLAPGARLRVSGASAEFFMGDVPGIGEVAATFVADEVDVIEASLPHWDSPFEVLYATFLDPEDS